MASYTDEQWSELCDKVKAAVPDRLGNETWYLVIAAALSASPAQHLLADFYTYLTQNDDTFKSKDAVTRLSLRLRDLLLKEMQLVGAPQVLVIMTALAKAEGSPQEKAPESVRSEKWNNIDVPAIHSRGVNTIYKIYGKNLLHDKIFPAWGRHTEDIQFTELFTIYGLYMSDFEQLTPLETEIVVLVSISCLGLRSPTLWHFRGLGRLLGARGTDETTQQMEEIKNHVRGIKVAAMTVVEFVGEEFERKAKIGDWPNVGDVKRDLGGWGEDAPQS